MIPYVYLKRRVVLRNMTRIISFHVCISLICMIGSFDNLIWMLSATYIVMTDRTVSRLILIFRHNF